MDLGVRDRGYLVLGGTAGIGRAAAQVLAADGARVAIAGRGAERAAAVAAELASATGATVVGLAGDLTEAGAAEDLVAQATAALGGLRGMAITTGLGFNGQKDLLSGTDADWRATFDDVLLATVRACRAAVPVLVEQGGGAIVTTAAYSIRAPKPFQVPYGALKAGVATLTKNIAKSFGAQGIRANCVCPGATETEILASMRVAVAEERGWPVEEALERAMTEDWGMKVALGRAGRPEELGDVIAFLLSERAAYLTGATINVDGGTDF
jgi:NAD(P)-dependent dehydrogenase (short-subunit alcohol dehydrogenase family)